MASHSRFYYFGDGRHRFFKILFKEWHRLLVDFEQVLRKYHDIPYWYNEWTNVGILATAAAFVKDTLALQEYTVQRGGAKGRVQGRADLWLHARGGRSYDFEFKIVYPSIRSTRTALIKLRLKKASADIRSLPRPLDASWGVALVFVVPGLPTTPAPETWDIKVWKAFVDHGRDPQLLGGDFVAIHRAADGVVHKVAKSSPTAGFHPGVAALGRVVRR